VLAIGGELVFEGALECGPLFCTRHKGRKIGRLAEQPAAVGEAKHSDHHQVADREPVAFEPLLVSEPIGQLPKSELREMVKGGNCRRGPLLVGPEAIEERAELDERLDAADRGAAPLDRPVSCLRIAGQQRFALLRDILDDRAAFEEPDGAVAEARDLLERLLEAVIFRPLETDPAEAVVEAGFFERPADAQVLDEPGPSGTQLKPVTSIAASVLSGIFALLTRERYAAVA